MRRERLLLAAALLLVGCAGAPGPPAIVAGTSCAACGMMIADLRYAAERQDGRRWKQYDSIECLLRDAPDPAPAWLNDYDARTLHAADSMWVVRGAFPSPMGGGFAAFQSRSAADEVATRTSGRVDRLEGFRAVAAEGGR